MQINGSSCERQLWDFARTAQVKEKLKQLHVRKPALSILAIAMDWILILGAVACALWFGGLVMVPAILVIGNRQRALVVLVHDASHYLLFRSRKVNDIVARVFLCWPMFISLSRYRDLHNRHHKNLGNPTTDTDYLHSAEYMKKGWWKTYSRQLFGLANLRSACVGMIPWLSPRRVAAIVMWWAVVLSVMLLVLAPEQVIMVLFVWFTARILIYHPIISFVIISDHVGLEPGTVLGFTRNHPRGWTRHFLHPHNNGWHLTHHLLPGIPFHALISADEILKGWASYAEAEHCETYISGNFSVLASWCGRSGIQRKKAMSFISEEPKNA